MRIVDYSSCFPSAVVAQGRGRDVIIVRRDTAATRYCVETRWLASKCQHPGDAAYVQTCGIDFTYFTQSEMAPILANLAQGRNLFQEFRLFA